MKNTITFNPAIRVRSIDLEAANVFVRKGKRVTADTYGEPKASRVMVIVDSKAGVIRKVTPTRNQRQDMRVMKTSLRSLNGLKGQTPIVEITPVKVKPTKWTITKVQKVLRVQESGNKRVTMFKLSNNKGIRKYFVSRKAAMFFRDNQPK